MIIINVSEIAEVPVEKVFNLLINYERYSEWWPLPVRPVSGKAGYYMIRPLPFIAIGIRIKRVIENELIDLEYVQGPFRGTAKWTFVPLSTTSTQISYDIYLKPTNQAVAFLASTALFKNKHVHDIKRIIDRIRKRALLK